VVIPTAILTAPSSVGFMIGCGSGSGGPGGGVGGVGPGGGVGGVGPVGPTSSSTGSGQFPILHSESFLA